MLLQRRAVIQAPREPEHCRQGPTSLQRPEAIPAQPDPQHCRQGRLPGGVRPDGATTSYVAGWNSPVGHSRHECPQKTAPAYSCASLLLPARPASRERVHRTSGSPGSREEGPAMNMRGSARAPSAQCSRRITNAISPSARTMGCSRPRG
eukprot:scaffold13363_cov101-Isochrysis_galbana.AAC.2